MKQPWQLNPALKPERLKQLASLIRNVRDEVIDLHDEELGDSARSTGLRAYECCRTRIIRTSTTTNELPWLGILRDDGRFTFSIDSVPVRFYKGNPTTPEERRLIPCPEATRQMTLLSPDIGSTANIVWFFAVEVDEFRYVEHVTFTGFLEGTQVSCWEIPLDEKVSAFNTISEDRPEPVKTQKASISIKKKEQKITNNLSSDG